MSKNKGKLFLKTARKKPFVIGAGEERRDAKCSGIQTNHGEATSAKSFCSLWRAGKGEQRSGEPSPRRKQLSAADSSVHRKRKRVPNLRFRKHKRPSMGTAHKYNPTLQEYGTIRIKFNSHNVQQLVCVECKQSFLRIGNFNPRLTPGMKGPTTKSYDNKKVTEPVPLFLHAVIQFGRQTKGQKQHKV